MPKVPQYQQNQVQVQGLPQTGQLAKASTETFGGGSANIANAVSKIAQDTSKIYSEYKRKADQIEVTAADAELAKLETELLYDKDVGALNARGKNAFAAGQKANEEYQKRSTLILQNLKNDDQRQAFQSRISDRSNSVNKALQIHMNQEGVRYDNDVSTSLIKNEQDAAIKNYNDPARVAQSLAKQEETIKQFAVRNGISEEKAKEQILESKSATHESVINRMLANDQDGLAASYFKKYKNDITGDKLARVENIIQDASTKIFAQRWVDKNINEDPAKVEDMMQKFSGKQREVIEQRYQQQLAIKKNLENKKTEDLFESSYDALKNSPDIFKLDPELRSQLTAAQEEKLTDVAMKMAKGKDIVTDPQAREDLLDGLSNPKTRDAFVNDPNLRLKYIDKINGTELDKILDTRRKLRFGDAKAKQDLDNLSIKDSMLKEQFEIAGFNSTNKKDYAQYKDYVNKQVLNAQNASGKKLSDAEEIEIAKSALLSVKRKGFLFNRSTPLFQSDDREAIDVEGIKIDTIPKIQRIRIENYFKQKGVAPSNKAIEEFYRAQLLKGLRSGK
jgi:hypothetical protein